MCTKEREQNTNERIDDRCSQILVTIPMRRVRSPPPYLSAPLLPLPFLSLPFSPLLLLLFLICISGIELLRVEVLCGAGADDDHVVVHLQDGSEGLRRQDGHQPHPLLICRMYPPSPLSLTSTSPPPHLASFFQVAFLFVIDKGLPKVPYFTIADWMMTGAFVFIFFAGM